jgi:hypothetical protein
MAVCVCVCVCVFCVCVCVCVNEGVSDKLRKQTKTDASMPTNTTARKSVREDGGSEKEAEWIQHLDIPDIRAR